MNKRARGDREPWLNRYSPDAKCPYPAKACVGVIVNFYS